MSTVLGIDLSTQSCTVEVRDAASFEVMARARVPLAPTSPPCSEQDAASWWAALCQACASLRLQVDLSDVAAVAASGQCHGLVALDEWGSPIRPVKLWNDTTSAPQIERLITRYGARWWARRCGSVPTAAFTIGKIAWLAENEPENFYATRHILLPHDYVTFRLTGSYVTDRSEASGTGYFDSVANEYDWEMLSELFGDTVNWVEALPRVGSPDGVAGVVIPDAAADLGIPIGIPVTVGGGDQHMSALGLGIDDGDVVISLGTSGVVYTSSKVPITTGTVDGVANVTGGWLPLICTLNSTKVTDWAASILGVDVHGLDELASKAWGSRRVPIFAAYLDGERSPAYPGVTGVIAGLTTAVTREEFAMAAFLGVACGLVRGLEEIVDAGVPVDGRYIAVGGGAHSEIYTNVLAELIGRPIELIDEPEATARGACVQALACVTGEGVVSAGKRLRPRASRMTTPYEQTSGSPEDRNGGASSLTGIWQSVKGDYLRVCDFAATTADLRLM